MTIPTPAAIKFARAAAGITQTAAARLVHTTCRVWQQWESGDRRMHPAMWELFNHKTPRPTRAQTPATLHPPSVLSADAN